MLKSFLVTIVLNALSLYLVFMVVDVVQYGGEFKFFFLAGLVLGLVNFFVKPILKLLSLPLILMTGGLFLIAINALVLWGLAKVFQFLEIPGVYLVFPNILSLVVASVIFGVINWIEHIFFK